MALPQPSDHGHGGAGPGHDRRPGPDGRVLAGRPDPAPAQDQGLEGGWQVVSHEGDQEGADPVREPGDLARIRRPNHRAGESFSTLIYKRYRLIVLRNPGIGSLQYSVVPDYSGRRDGSRLLPGAPRLP